MDDLGVEVLAGLIVLALGFLARLGWKHRETVGQRAREAACRRHQWEPINDPSIPGTFAFGYDEWCVKCNARR